MRDGTGKMREDVNRFPSGLQRLVSYGHGKGVSMGIGTDIGNLTRLGRPGSMGYERIDAAVYAEWGYDWADQI